MDVGSIVAVVAGAATAVGGFVGGRKSAASSALNAARDTVGMLESQLKIMQSRESEKESIIQGLIKRIEILEDMVLQREDITQLKRDVRDIKEKLDA